jgi:hypothetical protein
VVAKLVGEWCTHRRLSNGENGAAAPPLSNIYIFCNPTLLLENYPFVIFIDLMF